MLLRRPRPPACRAKNEGVRPEVLSKDRRILLTTRMGGDEGPGLASPSRSARAVPLGAEYYTPSDRRVTTAKNVHYFVHNFLHYRHHMHNMYMVRSWMLTRDIAVITDATRTYGLSAQNPHNPEMA